jgi:hypothetical protein
MVTQIAGAESNIIGVGSPTESNKLAAVRCGKWLSFGDAAIFHIEQ